MRTVLSIVMTLVLMLGSAGKAFAQQRADAAPAPQRLQLDADPYVRAAVLDELAAVRQGDSLKNGAIVGAVVAGAAAAAFMTLLIHGVGCVAEETPCGREIAIASLFVAGAAGAGALIGAGIDAALDGRPQGHGAPARLVPVLSPKRAGVFIVTRW